MQRVETTLSNSTTEVEDVPTYVLPVYFGGRRRNAEFIPFPGALNNRKLLGDFLEDMGIVISTPARRWYFVNEPSKLHPSKRLTPGKGLPESQCSRSMAVTQDKQVAASRDKGKGK